MNKFLQWIDEMGQVEIARRLGVTKQSVNFWRHKKCRPSIKPDNGVSMVQRIIEASNGRLTREDIRPDVYED